MQRTVYAAHYVQVAYERVVSFLSWTWKWTKRACQSANFWIAAATIAIAISTGIYTHYAGLQWQAMRGQLKEMRDTTNLTRKQMEGISAADVELARNGDIDVSFPVPPRGEIRANFVNNGHVIAHDVHFSLSLSLKSGLKERQILSKSETIPELIPTSVVNRPDFIHPFELSDEEYRQVMNTTAYLVVHASFDYDNGFDKRVGPLEFCKAYLWGPRQFGRWVGDCSDVQMKLREATESKTKNPN